jgi:hypothetical protein
MCCFFDKRATVVNITDKEVIDCFQDGIYHHRTLKTSVVVAQDQSPSSRT